MSGKSHEIVLNGALYCISEHIENTNCVVMQIVESDSEDELEIAIAQLTSIDDEAPLRINNYVETVVAGYSNIEFKSHFRLYHSSFEKLLEIIGPILKEQILDSNVIKKHVLAVIWLLATPASYRSVGERFDLAKSTLSVAFCRVINVLNKIYPKIISWPNSNRMIEIEEGFKRIAGIPKVLGTIDGTYIKIDAPSEYPQEYLNRKCYHSITLQAICDHTLTFTDVFVGYPSSVHDCRIFRNSDIYKNVRENNERYFPNGQFILGDKAYPSLKWCLVPYKDNGRLTERQKYYKTSHSTTRQTIERSFAHLFGRFRRLKHLQMKRIDWVPKTVLAACTLHNVCCNNNDFIIIPELEPFDGDNRRVLPITSLEENSEEALQRREEICEQLML